MISINKKPVIYISFVILIFLTGSSQAQESFDESPNTSFHEIDMEDYKLLKQQLIMFNKRLNNYQADIQILKNRIKDKEKIIEELEQSSSSESQRGDSSDSALDHKKWSKQVKQWEKEKAALLQQIDDYESRSQKNLKGASKEYVREIKSLKSTIGKKDKEILVLEERIEDLFKMLKGLEERIDVLNKEKKELLARIEEGLMDDKKQFRSAQVKEEKLKQDYEAKIVKLYKVMKEKEEELEQNKLTSVWLISKRKEIEKKFLDVMKEKRGLEKQIERLKKDVKKEDLVVQGMIEKAKQPLHDNIANLEQQIVEIKAGIDQAVVDRTKEINEKLLAETEIVKMNQSVIDETMVERDKYQGLFTELNKAHTKAMKELEDKRAKVKKHAEVLKEKVMSEKAPLLHHIEELEKKLKGRESELKQLTSGDKKFQKTIKRLEEAKEEIQNDYDTLKSEAAYLKENMNANAALLDKKEILITTLTDNNKELKETVDSYEVKNKELTDELFKAHEDFKEAYKLSNDKIEKVHADYKAEMKKIKSDEVTSRVKLENEKKSWEYEKAEYQTQVNQSADAKVEKMKVSFQLEVEKMNSKYNELSHEYTDAKNRWENERNAYERKITESADQKVAKIEKEYTGKIRKMKEDYQKLAEKLEREQAEWKNEKTQFEAKKAEQVQNKVDAVKEELGGKLEKLNSEYAELSHQFTNEKEDWEIQKAALEEKAKENASLLDKVNQLTEFSHRYEGEKEVWQIQKSALEEKVKENASLLAKVTHLGEQSHRFEGEREAWLIEKAELEEKAKENAALLERMESLNALSSQFENERKGWQDEKLAMEESVKQSAALKEKVSYLEDVKTTLSKELKEAQFKQIELESSVAKGINQMREPLDAEIAELKGRIQELTGLVAELKDVNGSLNDELVKIKNDYSENRKQSREITDKLAMYKEKFTQGALNQDNLNQAVKDLEAKLKVSEKSSRELSLDLERSKKKLKEVSGSQTEKIKAVEKKLNKEIDLLQNLVKVKEKTIKKSDVIIDTLHEDKNRADAKFRAMKKENSDLKDEMARFTKEAKEIENVVSNRMETLKINSDKELRSLREQLAAARIEIETVQMQNKDLISEKYNLDQLIQECEEGQARLNQELSQLGSDLKSWEENQ